MLFRILISGSPVLSADITPARISEVLRMTIEKLPQISERGRVVVTVDDVDVPNLVHILASKKHASDLGRVI